MLQDRYTRIFDMAVNDQALEKKNVALRPRGCSLKLRRSSTLDEACAVIVEARVGT